MFLLVGLSSFLLGLVVGVAILFLSFFRSSSREKVSGFECGFDSEVSSRSPFSLRFFILLLLFVVFDVEIALLIPCLVALLTSTGWASLPVFYAFLVVLGLGLFYEWADGGLDWLV
jgi:NADH:ubiquinone oxidoreductase subunit 3 (subunit A)